MIDFIVEAAARSLILGCFVWIVLAVMRPRNPYVEKTVWIGVLIASLAMPVLIRVHMAPLTIESNYVLVLSPGKSAAANGHGSVVPTIYGAILSLLLLRFAVGWWRMSRVRRNARKVPELWAEDLDVRAADVASPVTFGSTILMPLEYVRWSAEKLAAVIAHEGTHVRQRDCHVLWLAHFNRCLFWFSPFAWWIERRLSMLAETTSDEAALFACCDHSAYAQILLDFAKRRVATGPAMSMARAKVSARIERILSGLAPSSAPSRSKRAMIICALLPLVATAAVLFEAPSTQSATAQETSQGKPRIVSFSALEDYYPIEARRSGTEGAVEILVTLDSQGRATDTTILSEFPTDKGFGAAASAYVHTIKYSNPTGRTTQFPVRVKFALSPHDSGDSDKN